VAGTFLNSVSPLPPINKTLKTRDLVSALKALGFSGPLAGAKHPYMVRESDQKIITIINNHGEINTEFTKRLLKQWGISVSEWESV